LLENTLFALKGVSFTVNYFNKSYKRKISTDKPPIKAGTGKRYLMKKLLCRKIMRRLKEM
jgi:hypothetical protein